MHYLIPQNYVFDKAKSNRLAVCLAPALVVFFFLLTESPSVRNLAGAVCLLILLFSDYEKSFYRVLFLVPTAQLININGQTSIIMLSVVLLCLRDILLTQRVLYDRSVYLSFFLVVEYAVVSFACDATDQVVTLIKHFFFTTFFLLNFERLSEKEGVFGFYYNSITYIATGIALSGMFSILCHGLPMVATRWSIAPEISINESAILTTIILVNLLYIRFVAKGKLDNKKRKVCEVLMSCCFVMGLLSLSKSFFIGIFIALFFIFLFNTNVVMKMKVMLACVPICFAIIMIFYNSSLLSTYLDGILSRFFVEDLSNHRYDLWKKTIDTMLADPFYVWMGAGDYSFLQVTYERANIFLAAHNFFIEVWVIFGYIGCAFLLYNYWTLIKKQIFSYSKVSFSVVNLIPLISLMSLLFYSHAFIGKGKSFVFLLCFIPLIINVNGKK